MSVDYVNHPLTSMLRRLSTREQTRFVVWLEAELYTSRKHLGPYARF